MRLTHLVMLAAVLVVLGACRGREDQSSSLTGSYGNAVISGQAIMAGGSDNPSPAGVQVTVSGTGMTTTLGNDGRFSFVGVPQNAELHFARAADNVDLRLAIAGTSAPLHVQLTSNGGGHHRASGSEPQQQVEGTVVTASATSITIHDEHGKDVTLAITKDTIIRKGRTNVAAADLAKGTRVHAKALTIKGTATAVEIIVQDDATEPPAPNPAEHTLTANGPVTAVGASSITVNSEDHGSVTVNVDDKTIIRKQGAIIKLSDIKVADEVNTMGTRVDDHTELARQIEVRGEGQSHGH